MTKICKQCNIEKSVSLFYKEKGMKDGHRNECKVCKDEKVYARRNANPQAYNNYMQEWRTANPDAVKAVENKRYQNPERQAYCKANSKRQKENGYELFRLYGITKEQRFEMLLKQEGKCAICSKHESELKRGLMVDHCHITNKVRGLLCDHCNKVLGLAKDSFIVLLKAADYLKKSA